MSTIDINFQRFLSLGNRPLKQLIITGILVLALLAFELFNFDTTRFALENLLGNVLFLGIGWATILAIAFCGIDLAGLVRLFTPQSGSEEPKEVWYLMGAWLLGATMNAVMTWWAVSITLLEHDLGNEVLSREQLLRFVPIFVAVLVWLTRILFIGSLTMAGEQILGQRNARRAAPSRARHSAGRKLSRASRAARAKIPRRASSKASSQPARAQSSPANRPAPVAPSAVNPQPKAPPASKPVTRNQRPPNGRVRQSPPRPGMRPTSLNASGRYNR